MSVRLTIKLKLAFAFVTIMVLSGPMAVIGVSNLAELNETLQDLVRDNVPSGSQFSASAEELSQAAQSEQLEANIAYFRVGDRDRASVPASHGVALDLAAEGDGHDEEFVRY